MEGFYTKNPASMCFSLGSSHRQRDRAGLGQTSGAVAQEALGVPRDREGDQGRDAANGIAGSLGEAIEELKADELVHEALGDHVYERFVEAKTIEWNEYRTPDFDYLKVKMKAPVIFDGRNLYNPAKMTKAGFNYSGIGLFVPKS